jgi:predicted RNA polymerase sigma factor
MDYTIFYVLAAVILSLGIAFGVSYLRKNNYITSDDLKFASEVLGLTSAIVMELNLKQEPEIKKLTSIVTNSISYSIALYGENGENVIEESIKYAEDLCTDYNIELTDNRKMIIEKLITVAYQNKFMK